ncbi:MAG: hypothetical protein ACFCBU_17245 [Cyanophyceae cyanobacterium]
MPKEKGYDPGLWQIPQHKLGHKAMCLARHNILRRAEFSGVLIPPNLSTQEEGEQDQGNAAKTIFLQSISIARKNLG